MTDKKSIPQHPKSESSQFESTEIEVGKEINLRKEKLKQIRESQKVAFPNQFRPIDKNADLIHNYSSLNKEELAEKKIKVRIAGRMMRKRVMGKASFAHIQDDSSLIQIYLTRDDLPENVYNLGFKKWDIGDIVGISGELFKTNTGELSIHTNEIELLSKNLRPLPDKYHGLKDTEIRYRKRYLDLMMDQKVQQVFITRSRIIEEVRNFMNAHHFLEVETPMMHPIPGGANAKAFTTHHNAMDMELFLRIAPELYLKRLIVGGFNRVYEVNRIFRNEGISTRHNPEFTMMEFYQAYADYHDLMDFTEELFKTIAMKVNGNLNITYQSRDYDLSKPFERLSMKKAIIKFNPDLSFEDIEDLSKLKQILKAKGVNVEESWGKGKMQAKLFELSEDQLVGPVFITDHPIEISPLSRVNDDNPEIADRFELYIAGREMADGFSELNDPEDQKNRFLAQLEAGKKGDDEAMAYDEDYIEALEYAMPPTAGEGIGIDRLVMFFTDSASIRDVLLFPLLKLK